jgi:putative ABC transport system permease protein
MLFLRFACRVLTRDRSFTATAVLVLAIGIGVNNMMFAMIYSSTTLRGLPIERPDRVLEIFTFDQRFPNRALSYPEFDDLGRGVRQFVGLAAFASAPLAVADEGRTPERFDATYLSDNAFSLVGTAPIMGRGFTADDDRPGALPVAILGNQAWRDRYSGDSSILGRTILIDGQPATVIGVMPEPSGFPSTAQVWLPLSRLPGLDFEKRDARTLRVFGRLRADASEGDARAEVEAIVARGAREHPESSAGLQARVVRINTRFFGSPLQPTWMAFITASLLIVVVSSANAANLVLSRSVQRAREIAIRASLGAGRGRIVTQLLIESLVLATLGGIVGFGVSLGGIRMVTSLIPEGATPYWLDYSMDGVVFAALIGMSFLTIAIFGLVPALQASKTDVTRVLRDGGRGNTMRTRRSTFAFLAAEIALTVVLLAQAVVSAQNDGNELASDSLVNSTKILTASVSLSRTRYETPQHRTDFYVQAVERLSSIPGVTAAAVATTLPRYGSLQQSLDVAGAVRAPGERAPTVSTVRISPAYFDVFTVPLQRGRAFDSSDGLRGREHVIVNQRFAVTYFPGEDPLGKRVRLATPNAPLDDAAWHTIVGVATDIRQQSIPGAEPVVYLPIAGAAPPTVSLLLRSSLDPASLTQALRETTAGIDPNLPLYRVFTMPQALREVQWPGVVSYRLINSLTILALALSMAGLYGVTMYTVGQRTQEFGVRIALGAQPRAIRLLVLRGACLQVAVGLLLGVAGTVAFNAAFYAGPVARPLSVTVLLPVAVVLAIAMFIACLAPARRATRLDPVTALRQE